MRVGPRIIMILLVVVNSMGYDWLHTFWHYKYGPDLYHVESTDEDTLSRERDDRLMDTSQPGHPELSISILPQCPLILVSRFFIPTPKPTHDARQTGFPFQVFKPPRLYSFAA